MSVNKVIIVGRLGQDIKTKLTKTNSMVATASVCTVEKYGEKEEIDWHNLVFWGKTADLAAKFGKKGVEIYVEGKLKNSKYTDKDGVVKNKTDIIVFNFQVFTQGKKGAYGAIETDHRPDRSGDEPFDW